MNILNVERVDANGYPGLAVTIEEDDRNLRREALFTLDLKRTILERYNAVFLGPEFEDDYSVTLPADKADNRSETTLRGFSNDPKIVELVKAWISEPV